MSSQGRWKLLGALVIVSVVLGVVGWQQFTPKPMSPTTITITPNVTTVTGTTAVASTETIRTFKLFGKMFFDYNGNGKQDPGEPDLPGVVVALDGRNVTATNSTGWYLIDGVPQGTHTVRPYPPRNFTYMYGYSTRLANFRYMCESDAEFRSVKEFYEVLVGNDTRKDIGLMEGFLTLPLVKGTRLRYNAFFDDDRAKVSIKDWQGGSNTVDNHEGTDFGVPIGTLVLAAAPGVVKYVDDWGPIGIFVIISHDLFAGNTMSTLYAHLSSSKVKVGDTVNRGTAIGYSGQDTTKPGPHLHFELDFGYHGSPTRGTTYTPADVFRAVWDPNAIGYWTKDNDPQFYA